MLKLNRIRIGRHDLSSIRRFRLIAVVLVLGAALIGVGIWPLKLIPIGQAVGQHDVRHAFTEREINDQIRRGLGRQVRFASPRDSSEKVSESVWQVSNFIYERSGLMMSAQTRERLIDMESRALGKEDHRVGLDALSDALTETALERMSTLTDQEIENARTTFLGDGQTITTRASGGSLLAPETFVANVRALREEALRKDPVLRNGVRNFIGAEVASRAALLGAALSEDFGRASASGMTPLQAVVFTYSVASDDQLNGSRGELQEAISRINQAKGRENPKTPSTERAYGVNGRLFATPLNILFNPGTFNSFLDRIERGGAK
jgi:hypothetical protein